MTSLKLFLIIILTVLAQLGVFVLIAFYRHWLSYEKLKNQISDLTCLEPVENTVTPLPAAETISSLVRTSQLITPWQGTRRFVVQRKFYEDQHHLVCSFYLVPEDGQLLPAFKPGQYLTFELSIPDPLTQTPRKLVRCYTLSEQPRPDYYRITVKKVLPPAGQPELPGGVSSSYLHEQVQEGDTLAVRAPAGHFYLDIYTPDSKSNEALVLIAGGIGITPMLSMMHASLQQTPQREIWFYYGVRNSREQVMKEHIQELANKYHNLHLHICYSQPDKNDIDGVDYQHAARVDINLLRLTLPLRSFQFYVCGPKPMMETLVPAIENWGVPEHQIHYESFGPASISRHEEPVAVGANGEAKELATATSISVTFSKSGRTLQWDESFSCLLEFAEGHGINIDSGCRAGSCGTCQTRIESGEVEYNQEPDLDLEAGTCLLCVARPKTSLTLSA